MAPAVLDRPKAKTDAPASMKHGDDLLFEVVEGQRVELENISSYSSQLSNQGAFLTVRSILSEAGAKASEIAPSTLLAPYTRKYFEQFLGPISKLAPGALPPVRYRKPVYSAAVLGILLGMVWLVIGVYSELLLFTIAGVLLCVFCYAMTWVAANILLPSSVTFGELRTFRDLAEVIDKQHSKSFA